MAKKPPECYSVRLSKRFEIQAKEIFGAIARWDEIADALYRDVPMNPAAFPVVPGTGYHAVAIESMRLTVFFTIDEDAECIEFDGVG